MPAGPLAAINAIWLSAGFALVLWGLKIFRSWVFAFGAVAGAFIGAAMADAIGHDSGIVVTGGIVGALAGGLAAWPLQRLTVFLAAGVTTATVAAAAAVAFAGRDWIAGSAIVGFLGGGLLAALCFEYVVISAMAFTGAQAVFHAVYVPANTYLGTPREIVAGILAIYAAQFVVFIATVAVFVAFALWYQRGPGRRRERSPVRAARAVTARRVTVRLAFLVVAAWVAAALLIAAGFWPVSTYELIGMHPLSWPAVALAAVLFLAARPAVVTDAQGDIEVRRRTSRGRLLSVAAFAVIVPPVLTAGIFVALGGSWDGLADYYRAFLAGPAPVVATKWTLSLGLLPLLLFTAHPIVVMPAPRAAEPDAAPSEAGASGEEEDADADVADAATAADATMAADAGPSDTADLEPAAGAPAGSSTSGATADPARPRPVIVEPTA